MEKESKIVQVSFSILLLLTAIIWGAAFVAQSVGAEHVGAYTFLATRTWLAILVLIPVSCVMDRIMGRKNLFQIFFYNDKDNDRNNDKNKEKCKSDRNELIKAGCICGFFLFAGSATQQIGIAYTTTARSSFITAMYVVMVPLITMLTGHRTGIRIWACVGLCVAGLYLLCLSGDQSIGYGDIITVFSALFFALQILFINKYVRSLDGMKLAISQFIFTALISTVCMFVLENPQIGELKAAGPAILYAGILSSAVGYTLQVICQKHIKPYIASIIMCMESVFGALSGWLILGQSLSGREIAGCAIMFAAIILSQISG